MSAEDSTGVAGLGLIMCCILPICCAFVAAYIAYVTFGIIFLVQDQSVCSYESQIWIFGVVMLIVPCLASIPIQLVENPIGRIVAVFAFQIPLIVFGYLVLYDTSYSGYVCEAMKSEGLYIWALVAFWWLVTMAILATLFACIYCVLLVTHPELAEQMEKMQKMQGMSPVTEQEIGERESLVPKDQTDQHGKKPEPDLEVGPSDGNWKLDQKLDMDSRHHEPQPHIAHHTHEHHEPPAHHPHESPAHHPHPHEGHTPPAHLSEEHHDPHHHHAEPPAHHPQGFETPSAHYESRSARLEEEGTPRHTWEEVHTPHHTSSILD